MLHCIVVLLPFLYNFWESRVGQKKSSLISLWVNCVAQIPLSIFDSWQAYGFHFICFCVYCYFYRRENYCHYQDRKVDSIHVTGKNKSRRFLTNSCTNCLTSFFHTNRNIESVRNMRLNFYASVRERNVACEWESGSEYCWWFIFSDISCL